MRKKKTRHFSRTAAALNLGAGGKCVWDMDPSGFGISTFQTHLRAALRWKRAKDGKEESIAPCLRNL
jgi:hypothetical protein